MCFRTIKQFNEFLVVSLAVEYLDHLLKKYIIFNINSALKSFLFKKKELN